MNEEQKININGKVFSIVDAIEYITLADSFVKDNKIGNGHGEAKLYVGNTSPSNRIENFFDSFDNVNCFFLKKDLMTFLTKLMQIYFAYKRLNFKKNKQIQFNLMDTIDILTAL